MRIDITNDIGQVKLGDSLLPGVFQSLGITGKIKMDSIEIPGQSGESKQPLGFADAKLVLKLRLLNDNNSTPYEKLDELVTIFQSSDQQAKPYIYDIVNQHTFIWNIRQVIFDELKTSDTNKDDSIPAELHFTEYKPVMVKKEEAVEAQTPAETSPSGWADFKRESQATRTKTVQTPAIDDDEVT